MSRYVNNRNALRPDASGGYHKVIKKIQEDGICPFCSENLKKYHKMPILQHSRYWLTTTNMYPYKGSKKHLLIIHSEHITDVSEISREAWLDLHDVIGEIARKHHINGATLLLRFGDTNYTGASVSHLHLQLVSGSPNPDNPPILARVGNQ